MKGKGFLSLAPALGLMGLLLAAPGQAAQGVRTGMELCVELLIPSLFPLSVLAGCLLQMGLGDRAELLLGPWMRRQFGLSGPCAVPLAAGLIGGYPLGPQILGVMVREGSISRAEALRLSPFCNNGGLAFLLGTLGTAILGKPGLGPALVCIQAMAAWATGRLLNRGQPPAPAAPFSGGSPAATPSLLRVLPRCAGESALAMLRLCGVVSLFHGLLGGFEALVPLKALALPLQALLTGLLELCSGARLLEGIDLRIAFPLACLLVGWGGLCVQLQGAEALAAAELPLGPILHGKVLQGLLCGLLGLGTALLAELPAAPLLICGAWALFCLGIFAFSEKSHWKTEKAVV